MEVRDRHDLTDEKWALLETWLPDRAPCRGGRWADHRRVFNGVLRRTRSGTLWRDVPSEYRHWKTIYGHRRWSGDGTCEHILHELRRDTDVGEGPEWMVSIDAAVLRAHQHVAGARHQPPAGIAEEVLSVLELATGGGTEFTRNPSPGPAERRSGVPGAG